MPTTIEQLYGELWGRDSPEFEERINTSLNPRGSSMLYDLFAEFGVSAEQTVVDIGCRDARHAVELAKQFACKVVAIDLIPLHLEWAQRTVQKAGLEELVAVERGKMEEMPVEDASVDHIWCRDVTSLVDLTQGFAECHRVLKPGGTMMVYQTFATELCEPKEFRFLCESMAIRPENMESSHFENTAGKCGLQITLKDVIDSEWREFWLEQGDTNIVDSLLHVARMRRQREALIREYGQERFDAAYGSELWGVYQLLGKLCPTVYCLQKPVTL